MAPGIRGPRTPRAPPGAPPGAVWAHDPGPPGPAVDRWDAGDEGGGRWGNANGRDGNYMGYDVTVRSDLIVIAASQQLSVAITPVQNHVLNNAHLHTAVRTTLHLFR